ncbi:hypothetical protein KY289_028044 [Solanum tuberosum]|nr:hypothetical protein KY289_028044 [Solanum tuberosum]
MKSKIELKIGDGLALILYLKQSGRLKEPIIITVEETRRDEVQKLEVSNISNAFLENIPNDDEYAKNNSTILPADEQIHFPEHYAIENVSSTEGFKNRAFYVFNQVYLDVVEHVNFLVNSNGQLIPSEVNGALKMRAYLSGMPECKLGLNDKVLLEAQGRPTKGKSIDLDDINMLKASLLIKFENDRTISFIPPDGSFDLMTYRLSTQVKPLIWVEAQVERHSRSRVEMPVKARSQFKERSTATNVEIEFPVPSDAMSPIIRTSMGYATYAPERDAVDYMLRAEFRLSSVISEDTPPDRKASIRVKFEIPYFTVSGIQVRYLKIIEKSGYQALPWVRYKTMADVARTAHESYLDNEDNIYAYKKKTKLYSCGEFIELSRDNLLINSSYSSLWLIKLILMYFSLEPKCVPLLVKILCFFRISQSSMDFSHFSHAKAEKRGRKILLEVALLAARLVGGDEEKFSEVKAFSEKRPDSCDVAAVPFSSEKAIETIEHSWLCASNSSWTSSSTSVEDIRSEESTQEISPNLPSQALESGFVDHHDEENKFAGTCIIPMPKLELPAEQTTRRMLEQEKLGAPILMMFQPDVVLSDDADIVKQGCGKSFVPFTKGINELLAPGT